MNIADRYIGESPGRPPLVIFREDFVEDRDASQKAGHMVTRPINTVILRQPGARDTVEKVAEEWLETLSRNRDMRPEWVQAYKNHFIEWQKDRSSDAAVIGTHIKLWPAIDKKFAELFLNAGVRTVEDLAQANEELIARIGIGGREWQYKARKWLETSKNVGTVVEEVLALKAKEEANKAKIKELEEKLMLMSAGVRPGQTPKTVSPEDDFA